MTREELPNGKDKQLPAAPAPSEESDNDSVQFDEVIPTEILEEIPEEHRAGVKSSFSLMMGAARGAASSPLARKITSEHIGKMLDNSDKEDKRNFTIRLVGEGTKVFSVISVLALVSIVLFYAAKTKDTELSEKVFIGAVSAVGGAGVGYGIGKAKDL